MPENETPTANTESNAPEQFVLEFQPTDDAGNPIGNRTVLTLVQIRIWILTQKKAEHLIA